MARTLSDTFTGIAPSSVPAFVTAQAAGAALAVAAVRLLYPDAGRLADHLVVPHEPTAPAPMSGAPDDHTLDARQR